MILAALAAALVLVLALPADPLTGRSLDQDRPDRLPSPLAPLPPAAAARTVYRCR